MRKQADRLAALSLYCGVVIKWELGSTLGNTLFELAIKLNFIPYRQDVSIIVVSEIAFAVFVRKLLKIVGVPLSASSFVSAKNIYFYSDTLME